MTKIASAAATDIATTSRAGLRLTRRRIPPLLTIIGQDAGVRIADREFAARRAVLAERLGEQGLAGAVLFDPHRVVYYTGFAFSQTERPIAFALATDGRGGMLAPRLEVEH